MNLFDYVDIYCERVAPGFWAEPLNLLSNLFFVGAAAVIFARSAQTIHPLKTRIYAASVLAVGFASASFHAMATTGTLVADVVSIALCAIYFLYVYTGSILRYTPWQQAGFVMILVVLSWVGVFIDPNGMMNGSSAYLGILAVLYLLAALDPDRQGKRHMLIGALIFTVAIVFRSFDMAVCPYHSHGIHYIWHMANGYLLFHLSRRFMVAPFPLSRR
ncbi:MAG: ceramidase domain-containing protein [Proteobacteria bacterium]|nr:ceramidase domain-containing protein [Pseudomonadota bacterium]